jgi:hypothetical protein
VGSSFESFGNGITAFGTHMKHIPFHGRK